MRKTGPFNAVYICLTRNVVWLSVSCLACFVWCFVSGCDRKVTEVEIAGQVINVAAIDGVKFAPEKLPYTDAALILAGKALPVKMVEARNGEELKFRLVAFDQTVEEEVYIVKPGSFSVQRVSGELYQPPIPLLEYPARAGEHYDWVGDMTFGEQIRKANAKVELAGDKLNMFSGQFDSLRVNVKLQMDSGGPEPAVRKLSFWFVEGKGIVKREFGFSSTREPAPPPTLE